MAKRTYSAVQSIMCVCVLRQKGSQFEKSDKTLNDVGSQKLICDTYQKKKKAAVTKCTLMGGKTTILNGLKITN